MGPKPTAKFTNLRIQDPGPRIGLDSSPPQPDDNCNFVSISMVDIIKRPIDSRVRRLRSQCGVIIACAWQNMSSLMKLQQNVLT